LLLRTLLLLWRPVLLGRAVLLLRRRLCVRPVCRCGRWRFAAGLRLRRCERLRCCRGLGGRRLLPGTLLGCIVFDVDDAALRIERRGHLVLSVPLPAPSASAAAVAPEAAPSAAALTFLRLPLPELLPGAVAVDAGLRV